MPRVTRFRDTMILSSAGPFSLRLDDTMCFQRFPCRARGLVRALIATNLTIVNGVDISSTFHQSVDDVCDSSATRKQKRRVASVRPLLQICLTLHQHPNHICSAERPITSVTSEVQARVTSWLRASCATVQDHSRCHLR